MEHYAAMKRDGDHLSLLTWEDLSNLLSGEGGKQVTKHKQDDLISLKQDTCVGVGAIKGCPAGRYLSQVAHWDALGPVTCTRRDRDNWGADVPSKGTSSPVFCCHIAQLSDLSISPRKTGSTVFSMKIRTGHLPGL